MRHRLPKCFLILAAALVAGSSNILAGSPPVDDGRGDPLILITAMSPVPSTQLSLGATVTTEVTVSYILQETSGKIGLVAFDDAKHAIAQTTIDVKEGTANATLRLPFVVPASKMVTVKALLMTSEGRPFAKDSRTYTNIFAGPLAPSTAERKKK